MVTTSQKVRKPLNTPKGVIVSTIVGRFQRFYHCILSLYSFFISLKNMNADATEWKPNFGASEWSPSNNSGDSWEDNIDPPPAPVATVPVAAPTATDDEVEQKMNGTVEDELYKELQQLLDEGEITEVDFVEALLESGLPVDPEMQARVDAINAAKIVKDKEEAEAATVEKVKVATEEKVATTTTTTTTTAKTTTESEESDNSSRETKTNSEKYSGSNKSKAKPVPKNTKTSEHPDPDPRPHANVVFIGHVDAGKSTIAGTVMFVTGNVDQRLIDKYEREAKERNRDSWYMAYIMDTNDEERAKGKTVEVGMAHFTTDSKRFTVLDAPGHANYVPNMIGKFFTCASLYCIDKILTFFNNVSIFYTFLIYCLL
jgi:hypothetical protein